MVTINENKVVTDSDGKIIGVAELNDDGMWIIYNKRKSLDDLLTILNLNNERAPDR